MKDDIEKYSAIQLQKKAKAWIEIYNFNIKAGENEVKANAIVCFFFGLELYLKALLIALDKSFQDSDKLKKLGHNFGKIYCEVGECATTGLTRKTREIIETFNLFNINVADLRYPQLDSQNKYEESFYRGNHGLDDYFELLDKKIKKT